nr:MAG TPA: L-Villin-1, D-Villin-1nine, racemate, quasi-racemate, STRUCTURAL PROTEIN [Caudoviricetes sp.]
MGVIKGRTIAVIPATAEPIEPKREACADLTDAEFKEFYDMYLEEYAEWKKAQETPNPGRGGSEYSDQGPGVTGWRNPDTYTGPGVK